MKTKNKTQKGITLIALIITIIVLLILAVVAIKAVTGDGIIDHAKNARDNYSAAQIKESIELLKYQAQLESQGESSALTLAQIEEQDWIQDGSASVQQDDTTGKITVTIVKTGEEIIIEGKKEDGIEGEYFTLGEKNYKLQLNENKYICSYGNGIVENGKYTYENNKLILQPSDEENTIFESEEWKTFELKKLKGNQVLLSNAESEKGVSLFFATNATNGMILPKDGVYSSDKGNNFTISGGLMDDGDTYSSIKYAVTFNGNQVYLIDDISAWVVFEINGNTLVSINDGFYEEGEVFTLKTE